MVADVDGPTWAADHARGRRPDASPYGLHRLADHGIAAVPTFPASPRGGATARVNGTLRHRGGGWEWWAEARTRVPRGVDLRMCWDERTGIPALLRPGGPPVATGVIWLTEAPRPSPALALAARRALRHAAAVWVMSKPQIALLRDDWGVPERLLHWVPFGIDADFWSPRSADTGNDGLPVVLGVGNDRHRDHAGLVRAMAGLPARLELATSSPVTVPPEVGERVGPLDHVALRERYQHAAVVAVLLRPNSHVSGVTAVLEAQAVGRPVVVTDNPGMRDYVEPGLSAVLVPPGDLLAARRAVAELLSDPARAAAMGAAGRALVVSRGATSDMAERLAGLVRGGRHDG